MKFTVVLHSEDGQHYGVTVPDLPGCTSAGSTLDDALASASEAIELHVEGLLGGGGAIPLPLAASAHQNDPALNGGVWALVDVAVEHYFGPAEKFSISIPRLLLTHIDEHIKHSGQTRNDFLVEAASAALRKHTGD